MTTLSGLLRQASTRDIRQTQGAFFRPAWEGQPACACALGAMGIMHAYPETPLDELTTDQVMTAVRNLPVDIYSTRIFWPAYQSNTQLQTVIVDFNDEQELDFEQIADQLEAIGY